jgi:hypothetical protein
MTASQATNETRLPRAVLKRSAEIEAHLAAQREAHARLTAEPSAAPAPDAPPQVQTAETPPGAPAAPPADPRESDPAYWKHRFLTTDGVLRRQVDAHNSQLAAANQRVTELQEQVRTLQQAVPSPKPDITKFFSPEQIEKYGAEQCEVMLQGSAALAKDQVSKAIEDRVKPIEEEAKAKAEREAEDTKRKQAEDWQRFLNSIEAAHPGFKVLDTSPGWQAWLTETDPATDLPRQETLEKHVQLRNLAPIVRMLKTYEQSTRPPTPPVAPHGTAANGGSEVPPPSPAAQAGAPTDKEVRDFFTRAAVSPRSVTAEQRAAFEARMKLRVPTR